MSQLIPPYGDAPRDPITNSNATNLNGKRAVGHTRSSLQNEYTQQSYYSTPVQDTTHGNLRMVPGEWAIGMPDPLYSAAEYGSETAISITHILNAFGYGMDLNDHVKTPKIITQKLLIYGLIMGELPFDNTTVEEDMVAVQVGGLNTVPKYRTNDINPSINPGDWVEVYAPPKNFVQNNWVDVPDKVYPFCRPFDLSRYEGDAYLLNDEYADQVAEAVQNIIDDFDKEIRKRRKTVEGAEPVLMEQLRSDLGIGLIREQLRRHSAVADGVNRLINIGFASKEKVGKRIGGEALTRAYAGQPYDIFQGAHVTL